VTTSSNIDRFSEYRTFAGTLSLAVNVR